MFLCSYCNTVCFIVLSCDVRRNKDTQKVKKNGCTKFGETVRGMRGVESVSFSFSFYF